MAVAIKVPFSQEVPNAEHALAYRPGAMAAAGAEAKVWGAVGEMGGKTATAFDEWDRRRDEMELVDAKVAFSKAANDDQITWQQRTDLDQRDEKGLSGFRRAGTEFGAARESHAKEIGATLNRRVRDRFMAYAKPAGAEWTERLNLAMIDREYKFNFDKLKDDTSNAIATGDADLPDELAKTAHEWLRPEDWQTYADFQNEERVSDFIRRGMPELALANLDADPTMFGDKKKWDALHLDAEQSLRQRATQAQQRITANDRVMAARVLQTLDGSAGPDQIVRPSDVTNMMLQGQISEEAGKWAHGMLTKERPQDRGERLQAYANMRKVVNDLAQGNTTQKAACGAYYLYGDKLAEEDAEYFLDQITNVPSATLATYKKESLGDFDELIRKMQSVGQLDPAFDTLQYQGRFAKRLDAWSAEKFKEDATLDHNQFKEGALTILLAVKDEILVDRKAALAAEVEKKKGRKPPAGFEDAWPDFTEDQRKQIRKLNDRQRDAFLQKYKAVRSKPKAQPVPGPLPLPDIPTATMLGGK